LRKDYWGALGIMLIMSLFSLRQTSAEHVRGLDVISEFRHAVGQLN
jgi:hypothetical protein